MRADKHKKYTILCSGKTLHGLIIVVFKGKVQLRVQE